MSTRLRIIGVGRARVKRRLRNPIAPGLFGRGRSLGALLALVPPLCFGLDPSGTGLLHQTAMRVAFSWADTTPASSVSLKPAQVRALFRFLDRSLKKTPIYQAALQKLGVRSMGGVSLRFCDDVEMRGLQQQYRNLDRTTDILSFPTLEHPGVEQFMPALPLPERSWGDMVLAMPTVERGARRGRRTVSDELTEVLIHGFLHLLGMDHIVGKGVSPRHAREMKALQRRLFRAWKAESAAA